MEVDAKLTPGQTEDRKKRNSAYAAGTLNASLQIAPKPLFFTKYAID